MALYILFESASGYGLFERIEAEDIGSGAPALQKSINELSKFSKVVEFRSFAPFPDPETALDNINKISEGVLPTLLRNFLEVNLPKTKKGKFKLGVAEEKLGGAIGEELGIACAKDKVIFELIRGIRFHFHKFIKGLKKGDLHKSQLSLGHSYSRCKVKFNVNRSDNMIIQSISLLDTLDKDINTFSMRVKEWYAWHFPEMGAVVTDNIVYAKLVKVIQDKSNITEANLPEIEAVTLDSDVARAIVEAAKSSMGTDIAALDLMHVTMFAARVVKLAEYRAQLHGYLSDRMSDVSPNLTALVGEHVGARLISHAGSLVNLAKYPASTVQILGAEKALFRALKTRGNTPKYGLIFHSSFIGRAGAKNKGRISRYLANKCSIASRIDAFSDDRSDVFGTLLHKQVEDRLKFYESGTVPPKNIDVMSEAIAEIAKNQDAMEVEGETKEVAMDEDGKKKKKKKNKKKKKKSLPVAEEPKEEKKGKKGKKRKREEAAEPVPAEPAQKKKKKRKRKKSKGK
eukprot:TRINITY_DN18010_c0_g1_i1.p1 TRINITY_DN18010_c0_g1~~TRINITY_DN18010_c0_g1_i1.p1  ORF type:complete len:514 (+),score=137.27 TRINITY_DN18010_c0_g1_i1:108-1649(+)